MSQNEVQSIYKEFKIVITAETLDGQVKVTTWDDLIKAGYIPTLVTDDYPADSITSLNSGMTKCGSLLNALGDSDERVTDIELLSHLFPLTASAAKGHLEISLLGGYTKDEIYNVQASYTARFNQLPDNPIQLEYPVVTHLRMSVCVPKRPTK